LSKKIIIIIDALRWDYISKKHTPFLYSFSKQNEYIKKLIPGPGFCERTEIFTGLDPFSSRMLLAYEFNNLKNNNKSFNLFASVESILPSRLVLNIGKRNITLKKIFRKIISKFYSKINFQLIPFDFVSFFDLSEDKNEMASNFFPHPNFFKDIQKRGKKYSLNSFTGLNFKSLTDDQRIELLTKELKDKAIKYHFLYIGQIDFLGHKFGPETLKKSKELYNFDLKIKSLLNNIKTIHNASEVLIIGDHGMSEVLSFLDVEIKLNTFFKLNKLKRTKDYIYFLDSNYLRIWFHSNREANKLKFKKYFNYDKQGDFLDDQKLNRLNGDSNKYGDILWFAKEGVLIYPNFFNHSKQKGMHGYYNGSSDSYGLGIISNNKNSSKEELDLKQINSYLK